MTVPRLDALFAYWQILPPVHIQFARLNSAVLKPADSAQKETASLGDLVRDFGAIGGTLT